MDNPAGKLENKITTNHKAQKKNAHFTTTQHTKTM